MLEKFLRVDARRWRLLLNMLEARLFMLPLLLLWAGPVAILLAHLSLGQFKLFFAALDQAARRSDGFWRYTHPGPSCPTGLASATNLPNLQACKAHV